MNKNIILLIAGAVLTALFVVFSAAVFEVLYYEQEFSYAMYNHNLYFVVALLAVIEAWGFAALYYYVINSVRFSRWYHWLAVLAVTAVLVPLESFVYIKDVMNEEGVTNNSYLFGFCMVLLCVEAVLFIVASFSMRWWSTNCRHTPIPE